MSAESRATKRCRTLNNCEHELAELNEATVALSQHIKLLKRQQVGDIMERVADGFRIITLLNDATRLDLSRLYPLGTTFTKTIFFSFATSIENGLSNSSINDERVSSIDSSQGSSPKITVIHRMEEEDLKEDFRNAFPGDHPLYLMYIDQEMMKKKCQSYLDQLGSYSIHNHVVWDNESRKSGLGSVTIDFWTFLKPNLLL